MPLFDRGVLDLWRSPVAGPGATLGRRAAGEHGVGQGDGRHGLHAIDTAGI